MLRPFHNSKTSTKNSLTLRSLLSPAIILSLFLPVHVHSQSVYDLDDLEEGEIILNLSVTEQVEAEQDTLNANLQYIVQGKDRVEMQEEVNLAMSEALEILNESDELEFSTQHYQVYIIQNGRSNRSDSDEPVWRAQQGISLSSKNSAAVLDKAGQLQNLKFTMNGLNYSLSSEQYEEISDSLMISALQKLQNRADEAARALNKEDAVLLEINLNGSPNQYYNVQPMAMRAQAMESFNAPVAEPGITPVSLSISARALLKPDD